jgi:hypothetical protein
MPISKLSIFCAGTPTLNGLRMIRGNSTEVKRLLEIGEDVNEHSKVAKVCLTTISFSQKYASIWFPYAHISLSISSKVFYTLLMFLLDGAVWDDPAHVCLQDNRPQGGR